MSSDDSGEISATKPTVDAGPGLDSFEQRLKSMMESSDLPESLPRDLVGTTIADTYTLVSKLGAGGMGEVYLAEHARTEGRVALKLIKSARLADADGLKRFELEAKNTAALEHPNIVRVFDYGHEDDLVYIAMEYIGGKSLADVIDETGTLSVDEAIEVADAVLLALEAAHEASIVHRDIKPGNILIAGTGTDRFVKVLDFGIARALEGEAVKTQGIIGSPSSMAPEQFEGTEITPATDLYAVGCLMHAMLTGRGPFSGKYWKLATLHCTEPPPRLENVPDALADWTLRLLEKEAEDRPASAREALESLRSLNLDTATDRPEPPPSTNPTSALPPDEDNPPQQTDRGAPTVSRAPMVAVALAGVAGLAALIWTASNDDETRVNTATEPTATTTPSPARADTPIVDHEPMALSAFENTNFFFRVSPDGKRLAISTDRQTLEVRELGERRTETIPFRAREIYDVRWFPDSEHLLLSSKSEDSHCLVKLALDGANDAIVCRDEWLYGAVSPDGDQLSYTTSEAVVIANADGSSERIVDSTGTPLRPHWLSDGSGVVFITRNDAASTQELRFASLDKSAAIEGDLKPNSLGSQEVALATMSNRRLILGGREGSARALWLGRLNDALKLEDVVELATREQFWFSAVSASRDGLVSYCRSSSQRDIELGDFDGDGVTGERFVAATSAGERAIDWGPAGQLLFASMRTGQSELFTVDPGAGNVRRLTRSADDHSVSYGGFAGDQGAVLFFDASSEGAWPKMRAPDGQITTVSIGRDLPLPKDPKASPPWRLDIRCTQSESPRCVVYEVSDLTGTFRELGMGGDLGDVIAQVETKTPTPDARMWDYNGETIALIHGDPAHGLTFIDTSDGAIEQIELAGRDRAKLGYWIMTVTWHPDGKSVLTSSASPTGFRLSRVLRTGEVSTILVSPSDAVVHPVASRDGKVLAWSRSRYQCVPWTFRLADR